jgi:SWI/SNF-related matrix-associated actin-dependent regulator 1 of chromatin subfamily A
MLQVRRDGNDFIARLSFDERKRVSFMGFKWDKNLSRWSTPNARAAYRLFENCDGPTKNKLIHDLELPFNFPDRSINVVAPSWITPYSHQIEFARWVLSRRASYIAGEAGTGKSATLGLCLNTVPGRAIVTCPSFLKLNWDDEIEKWSTVYKITQILKKASDHLDPEADIYITPDSLLHVHEFREKFFTQTFDYNFIDESHRFKTAKAKRTMSLLGARKVKVKKERVTWKGFHHICKRTIAMSGTPMPNRPLELYPLVSRHAPQALNYFDPHRFGLRYCDGHLTDYGWDYTGASHLEELNIVLCRNYMIVKRLEDCVDLPPKLPAKFIYIDDDRPNDLKGDEMKILKRFRVTDLIRLEVERSEKFRDSVTDKLEASPELGAFGFLSQLRLLTGLRKVGACASALKEMIESYDKIIVFCWHKEVVLALALALGQFSPLVITGKTPNTQRHEIVKSFQTNSAHKFLIGNIQAMGVGLNLTASSVVAFVEPSWVPGENDQGVSRAYRIGQLGTVRPFFFVVKDSLDHLVLNAHQDKKLNISSVIKPVF